MKYKVLSSFCGAVCAAKGETIELKDRAVIKDLTAAGYIVKVGESKDEKSEANDDENVGVSDDEDVGNKD